MWIDLWGSLWKPDGPHKSVCTSIGSMCSFLSFNNPSERVETNHEEYKIVTMNAVIVK